VGELSRGVRGCQRRDMQAVGLEARDMRERRDVNRLYSYLVSPVPLASRGSFIELCLFDAFLYKNDCAGY
jgi:hypothetical protein